MWTSNEQYTEVQLELTLVNIYRINSDDFNFCILWTSITVLLIYGLNVSGFVFKLFGKFWRLLLNTYGIYTLTACKESSVR